MTTNSLEYQREWRRKNEYSTKEYARRYRENYRELMSQLMCVDCGISDPRVLQWHHRNPETKSCTVSSAMGAPSKLLSEIEKCDVLCANCHMIRHSGKKKKKGKR